MKFFLLSQISTLIIIVPVICFPMKYCQLVDYVDSKLRQLLEWILK